MLELLGSSLGGGLLGILGSGLTSLMAYFKNKQSHKQNIEVIRLEHDQAMAQIKLEAEFKSKQLQIESETEITMSEYKAFAASYDTCQSYDGDNKLLVIAEFCRRMTRPVLVAMLVTCTFIIYFNAPDAASELIIIKSVLAMTSCAVLWYYGDRSIAKQIANKVL